MDREDRFSPSVAFYPITSVDFCLSLWHLATDSIALKAEAVDLPQRVVLF
ncbi:MAG TPA: hypothetical protein IGS17_07525 [Oscillatoriales cyanobacterium M59_W2019_021]|nr:hypothetical protein [Oscillatoriales cyanobacterium M4454_W2019_049]HIK50760.1 hypothetical protein [Oscillatoriales cyanobacterium M59_W2019_021]